VHLDNLERGEGNSLRDATQGTGSIGVPTRSRAGRSCILAASVLSEARKRGRATGCASHMYNFLPISSHEKGQCL